MNKLFIAIFLASQIWAECPCNVMDPIHDPDLSLAAKMLYVCIMSDKDEPGCNQYFKDLQEEDDFYDVLCELRDRGYL